MISVLVVEREGGFGKRCLLYNDGRVGVGFSCDWDRVFRGVWWFRLSVFQCSVAASSE